MSAMIRKATGIALFLAACVNSYAQSSATSVSDQAQIDPTVMVMTDGWKPSLRTDGAYDKVKRVGVAIPWAPIRENDVMWKKRIWREIDTREKMNLTFRYPGDAEEQMGGGMFIEMIFNAIKSGQITAFSTVDERFTTPLTPEDVMNMVLGTVDTLIQIDAMTGEERQVITRREFDPTTITKFRLKEEWVVDRNQGRMVCRIIGISPIIDKYDVNSGELRGTSPMFWLYYPDLRPILAKYEAFNPYNDAVRLTWDDIFEKRFFSSYIIKASNPYDRSLKDYKEGVERLFEAEKINEEIFNKEQDLWVN
jgi:gliding motility associated protien GldN